MKNMRKIDEMNKNLSRRDFLRLGGLSTGALVLAACGGQQAEEPAEEPAEEMEEEMEEEPMEEAPAAEGKTVTWWFAWGNLPAAIEQIEQLDSFKEHIGNQTFEWQSGMDDAELLPALAAGEPPDGMSNVDYAQYWARGAIIPVDDMVAASEFIDLDDILPGLVEGAKYDGQMIGVIGLESFIWWGLDYNTRLVEEAGLDPDSPPVTYDEGLVWHEALTQFDDAGNLIQFGYDPYDAMANELDYPAFSHGLRWWVEDEKRFDLDNDQMAESIDKLGEFYRITGPDNMAAMRATEGMGTWGGSYNAEVQAMIMEGYWHPGETQIQQPDVAQFNRASWPMVSEGIRGKKIMGTGPHLVIIFKEGMNDNQEGMFQVAEFLQMPPAMDIIWNEVGWVTGRLSYLETVDPGSYPGIDFYLNAPTEVDEYLVGRRCPIHGYATDQFVELREQVYRDLTSPTEAAAELQRRIDAEWEAQGLG